MGINVLSLFDGMSCCQIALKELGIKVEKYYASEIDKHAIKQTLLNFPDTIQLGSVTEVDARKLPKIDLLAGGSPCTNFSFAGRRNGMNTTTNEEIYTLERYLQLKKEGFEFDGESFLFWEYMRILGEVREKNPNVLFFLENVEMGEKWEAVLTRAIGIPGVHVNSALVSAQNRRRIYWTNIRTKVEGLFGWTVPDIPQPYDRGIMLADVLEDEVDERYYLKAEVVDKLLANGVKGAE
ncbi:MAG: DNA cytosine methyltransferase [Fibrobacter sp.]|nr:DNA cytosine methyltransferase [Fibrobacter sp.]MBR6449679.1 DNA cytosine methyltransferase [Fibrobacter sp.]